LNCREEAGMTGELILLPGLICDERLWRDVMGGLECRSMVADLTQDDSIAAMAARVLSMSPARFALAGLSMGGYVAFEIMRRAPERVTHLALLDTSARADDAARRETRRKGIEMVREGKFSGVARGLLPNLLASRHLGTPLAREVLAMSERVGEAAYIRQQEAIMNRVDSRPHLAAGHPQKPGPRVRQCRDGRLKAVFGAFVAAFDLLRCPERAFSPFPGRLMA